MTSLLESASIRQVIQEFSREEVIERLRARLDDIRAAALKGDMADVPDWSSPTFADELRRALQTRRAMNLRPVINATGIIIHTNLGRARLAPEALQAMHEAAASYSNLELDLNTGKRGSRYAHVESLICNLTGAEAAIVVNNCAAAVLLGLMGTACGKKVIVSRGELIEIGGAFRLPDVIDQSGAQLKEVGTTNKTRLSDYERAIEADTAVLLKSHTSNYRIIGFTSAPERIELARLAHDRGLLLVEDLGSGTLVDLSAYGMSDEPVVADVLESGVDLVMFSGDKLLGGPQAGILAGRRSVIGALKSHPLLRALRIDKLSLAALEATLRLYLPPNDPLKCVPVLNALSEPVEQVRGRALALMELLPGVPAGEIRVVDSETYVGGGAMPGQGLHSVAVSVRSSSVPAESLAAALRRAPAPVIGRIHDGALLLDMRTVRDAEVEVVASGLRGALSG